MVLYCICFDQSIPMAACAQKFLIRVCLRRSLFVSIFRWKQMRLYSPEKTCKRPPGRV